MSDLSIKIQALIDATRKQAEEIASFPVATEFAKLAREAMCSELLEDANRFERMLKICGEDHIEDGCKNVACVKRNCDRFNRGNKVLNFKDAVTAFEKETGKVLYNCQPGYNSSGDFVQWLLSSATTQTNEKSDDDYGSRFYVLDWVEGRKVVTRSKVRAKHNEGCRVLTRNDIYNGRMEKAQCEYAHAFMCGGFPSSPDPTRPSKEEWLSEEPYEFEVDEFISEKLFQDKEQ